MTSADAAEAGAPGAAALGSPPGSSYGSGKWHAKACGAPSSGGRSTRQISCTFGQRVENGHPVAAAEAMPCIVRVRCARRLSPGMEAASGGRAWGGVTC